MTLIDGAPWDEREHGDLNPSSHAAAAAFDLVGHALRILDRAEYKITPRSVRALSATLLHIVNTAQVDLVGRVDLQSGSHTRLREALTVALAEPSLPSPPLYTSVADMDVWVTRTIRRVCSIAAAAVALWAQGPGEQPWAALFSGAPTVTATAAIAATVTAETAALNA